MHKTTTQVQSETEHSSASKTQRDHERLHQEWLDEQFLTFSNSSGGLAVSFHAKEKTITTPYHKEKTSPKQIQSSPKPAKHLYHQEQKGQI